MEGIINTQENLKKSTFIVFEGISACGKSIKIEGLTQSLRNQGFDSPVIIEWNSNKLFRSLTALLGKCKLLNARVYSVLQWISFLVDYFTKILPALYQEQIVIADRYIYTGVVRDWVNGNFKKLGKLISNWVIEPDILYFCDADPKICYRRIEERKKVLFYINKKINRNRFLQNKDLYYLKKTRYAYLELMEDIRKKKNTTVVTLTYDGNYSERIIIEKPVHLDFVEFLI